MNQQREEVIKLRSQRFIVNVIEYLDYFTQKASSYGIRLGKFFNLQSNKIEPCVSITVTCEYEDERMRSKFPAHIAAITRIDYHPNCCLNDLLIRGTGTIQLIKIAMVYVMQTFPWVKCFSLEDSSKILCGPEHLHMYTSLQTLSLITNGKTWYEKYFEAKIADQLIHSVYRQRIDLLSKNIDLSFDQFCKICNIPTTLKSIDLNISQSIVGKNANTSTKANSMNIFKQSGTNVYNLHALLQTYYNNATNYLDFFINLRKDTLKHSEIPFCWIVNSWALDLIEYILQEQPYLRKTWIIDGKIVNNFIITIEKQNGGFKKRNKKNKSLLLYKDFHPVHV